MDADFGEIQPEELRFMFEPKTKISCFVKLMNNSGHHIAYRIYSTHAELYCCRKKEGIIKPGSTCDVEVIRKKQDVAPLPKTIAKERLHFKRIFVPEDTDIKDIASIFHCHKCNPDINKKYLKVVVDVIPRSEEMDSKTEEQDLRMAEARQMKSMKLKMEDMDLRLKEAEETISKLKERKNECDYKGKKMRPSVLIKCFNVKLV
ncbi:vesicle-associated protein 2-1-like [Cynara cardunculus var. scolymus]|uniref:vesicle-associated protein 2-1-like n=1 Tax=Cynara cardunculus var. scolymus TaxID=59895 RepID=UPI000D630FCC|nr:vesicle-associated protein 2-1-like [Cynara cardunculus var. scolymus]